MRAWRDLGDVGGLGISGRWVGRVRGWKGTLGLIGCLLSCVSWQVGEEGKGRTPQATRPPSDTQLRCKLEKRIAHRTRGGLAPPCSMLDLSTEEEEWSEEFDEILSRLRLAYR